MHVAIFNDDPACQTGESLRSAGPLTSFLCALKPHFDVLTVSVPLSRRPDRARFPYEVQNIDGVRFAFRPYFLRKAELVRRPWALVGSLLQLWRLAAEADRVLVRLPSPLAFVLVPVVLLTGGARFLIYIAGDLPARNLGRKGLGGLIRKRLALGYAATERWLARRCPTVAAGPALATRYHCPVFFTNLIRADEITWRTPRLDTTGLNLLFVGRLDRNKGVGFLIDALAILQVTTGTRLSLDIIGDGPERSSLERQVAERHLEDRVRFAGHVGGSALKGRYLAADVLVLPSLSEGIPKVLLEAMSFSLVIVATRVGGVPWLCDFLDEQMLVEPGSADALAAGLRHVLEYPERREAWVRVGVGRAASWSYEAQLGKLAAMLRQQPTAADGGRERAMAPRTPDQGIAQPGVTDLPHGCQPADRALVSRCRPRQERLPQQTSSAPALAVGDSARAAARTASQ